MCGRVAQSRRAVQIGAQMLLGEQSDDTNPSENDTSPTMKNTSSFSAMNQLMDNWNLAPGMESTIFLLDIPTELNPTSPVHSRIRSTVKVWGIIPKDGSAQNPLPPGPNKHFSHLMYNARSETLYEKRTFRDLAVKGNVSGLYFNSLCFIK